MARPLRLTFPGAVYHVMSRGHERAVVFRDDKDRERLLRVIGAVAGELGWVVHGYCLMDNHFHILIETPRGNLPTGMRSINSRYAQGFNRSHRRRGHLFEGRYKAVLVQKDTHLLELLRYVVLNPVRAKMTRTPEAWPWSSYRATAGLTTGPAWLTVDWTLGVFARTKAAARLRFRRFVAAGRGARSPLEDVEGQIYLGDAKFVEGLREKSARWSEVDEIPRVQRRGPVNVRNVRDVVAREWNTSPQALSRSRGGEDKLAAMYLARRLCGLAVQEVAREFGVKSARVSNAAAEVDRMPESSPLRSRLARLEKELRRES